MCRVLQEVKNSVRRRRRSGNWGAFVIQLLSIGGDLDVRVRRCVRASVADASVYAPCITL